METALQYRPISFFRYHMLPYLINCIIRPSPLRVQFPETKSKNILHKHHITEQTIECRLHGRNKSLQSYSEHFSELNDCYCTVVQKYLKHIVDMLREYDTACYNYIDLIQFRINAFAI